MSQVISIRIDETLAAKIEHLELDKREIFQRGLDIVLKEHTTLARSRLDTLIMERDRVKNRLDNELEVLDREIEGLSKEMEEKKAKVLELFQHYLKWIQDRSFKIRRMDYAEDPKAWILDRARDHPALLDPYFQEHGIKITAAEVLEIMEGA